MRPAPDPCSLDALLVNNFHMSASALRFSGALVYVSSCSSILSLYAKMSFGPSVFACVGLSSAIVSARKSVKLVLLSHDRALSAALERNLFKAASLPLSRCICFRLFDEMGDGCMMSSGSPVLFVCPRLPSLPLLVVHSDSVALHSGVRSLPFHGGPCASSSLTFLEGFFLGVIVAFSLAVGNFSLSG
ncbi:hypothetical protein Tco_0210021 [Tanacetum coccineum]